MSPLINEAVRLTLIVEILKRVKNVVF
jgi:hypothetical protein